MARRKNAIFSVYHALDENGYFDGGEKFPGNPANSGHQDYKGPVEYPRMFYHPKGEMRITQPAEIIMTPIGPKAVNEHKELIAAIAENEADGKRFREAGWHDTPAKAEAAAGRREAKQDDRQRIADLELEIKRLQAQRNSAVAESVNASAGASAPGPMSAKDALASTAPAGAEEEAA